MILVLLSCPESIEAMHRAFPDVKIVTAALDSHLNSTSHRIVPGFGDFGARYDYGCSADPSEWPRETGSGPLSSGKRSTRSLKRRKTRRKLANKNK